ncbi:MAG: LytTR family DNA-binding domain-containing protein [Massilibacteroides sp.]|nr:LytTR family DNA-binding domain-containing protein [Massilibacteroides sp.]MDD4116118.1 LytTR family DNA-binding domain-containing protein [Massilibacteroides sp.]MDD4661505.1 LytTR family DNA-binding domain-containing protein [Massilibacteroides sp.]
MRVLIVEDETSAYINLKKILEEIDNTIEIAENTESIKQTVKWLENNTAPDLIFMDIHLSDGSAFNIFNLITVDAPIVFTTAYDEYAIEAFKVNSIDYLMKPIEKSEVKRAIDKYRKLNEHDLVKYINQLSQLIPSGRYPEKLLIPVNDKLIQVALNAVACFYTTDNSTQIILLDGQKFFYNKSLDSIMNTVNPSLFFRANKQFIIAKKHVSDITIWFDNRLLILLKVETPERIYISKNKAALFKQWMIS